MGYLAALFQWLWAPLLAAGVSVVYFQSSKNPRKSERIATSLHGAVLAALYLGALAVHRFGISHPAFGNAFWLSLLVPAGLAFYSLASFRGNKQVHFLQLAHLLAALWIWFVGTMSVTGNWL
jgi:thiosulfate reductase cytochrome b subunit